MTQRENEIAATQSILLLDSCERFSSKDREHLLAQLQDTQPDRSRTPESGYAFPHRHPKLTIRGIDQIFWSISRIVSLGSLWFPSSQCFYFLKASNQTAGSSSEKEWCKLINPYLKRPSLFSAVRRTRYVNSMRDMSVRMWHFHCFALRITL